MSCIETVPRSTEPSGSVSAQIARHCLLTRTRQIARVLTALYDEALRPLGIEPRELPLSPERVWELINARRSAR